MMNQGYYPGGMGYQPGMPGMPGMPGHQPGGSPFQPIVCPTQYRFNDCFTRQEVPFIHPIVNVNRHHVVGVPEHYYTETTQDVAGANFMPGTGPSFGPGQGGMWGGGGMGGCHRRRCR